MTVEKDECREAFEQAIHDMNMPGLRDDYNAYWSFRQGWQAHAALEAKPAATQYEELVEVVAKGLYLDICAGDTKAMSWEEIIGHRGSAQGSCVASLRRTARAAIAAIAAMPKAQPVRAESDDCSYCQNTRQIQIGDDSAQPCPKCCAPIHELTEAEKEHAVYLIAEKQANGWDYGTDPREKAEIVLTALLERFTLIRRQP